MEGKVSGIPSIRSPESALGDELLGHHAKAFTLWGSSSRVWVIKQVHLGVQPHYQDRQGSTQKKKPTSSMADRPSRGLTPECLCGWDLRELKGIGRWSCDYDGNSPGRPVPPL